MKKKSLRTRAMRSMVALAVGGTPMMLLGSCDDVSQEALLGGLEETVQTLSETLISVFFLNLVDEPSVNANGLTTT